MKRQQGIMLAVLAVALTCVTPETVQASGTYFKLTSNHPNPIPNNINLMINAETNDQRITNITFEWYNPANQLIWNDSNVPVHYNGGYWEANSTHTPNSLGTWTVNATTNPIPDDEQTRKNYLQFTMQIPINNIPEIPIIGTAGLLAAMALGLFYHKKQQTKKIKP